MYTIFCLSIILVTVGCGFDERRGGCYGSYHISCEKDNANTFDASYKTKLIADDLPLGECPDRVQSSELDLSIPFDNFHCTIQGNVSFKASYDNSGVVVCKNYDETKSITYNHDTNTASYSEGEGEPIEFSCESATSYYAN